MKNIKMADSEWQTFRPTFKQFSNLSSYIQQLESQGAHKAGILKIIPPKEWNPRREGYNLNNMDFKIESPIQQSLIPASGIKGVFRSQAKRLGPLNPNKYAKLAQSKQYVTPTHTSYAELEEKYWDSQNAKHQIDPVYGADVNTSLIDEECKAWNVSKIESILSEGVDGTNLIPGVNNSYLYFGMWRATFSWHVEDMDLYATNYLHYGAPKTWYCVPPDQAHLLERAAGQLYPEWKHLCPNFMRHKICMIDPKLLRRFGITVNKMVQEERNFIVVFPHAFHAGFNHGFNIAEAANFALPRWVEYGKRFRSCCCSQWISAVDGMRLSMDYYIQKYQPNRYQAWKDGTDYGPHPEDPEEVKKFFADLDLKSMDEELKKTVKRLAIILDLPCLEPLELKPEVDCFNKPQLSFSPSLDASDCTIKTSYVKVNRVSVDEEELLQLSIKREANENKENDPSPKKKRKVVKMGFNMSMEEIDERKSVYKCRKRHRLLRCKKCDGCQQGNCGECEMCQDMPKFGGTGKLKQKCIKRVCTNPAPTVCSQCKWNIK